MLRELYYKGDKMEIKSLVRRKMTVTYVTTLVISIVFACLYMTNRIKEENLYNLGSEFLTWILLFSTYVGAFVLIYGNLVSVGLEYLYKKWFIKHTWLYVLLHGMFGLFSGLLFQITALALVGMIVALFYTLIDRWLYVREKVQLSMKMFFLFPIVACGLLSGYFQLISKPLPPFTMEDAVELAIDSLEHIADIYPENVGKWDGMINGYQVERETSAKEIGKESYIITFTERWEKGKENGSWGFSYEVKRGSLSAISIGGDELPYFK